MGLWFAENLQALSRWQCWSPVEGVNNLNLVLSSVKSVFLTGSSVWGPAMLRGLLGVSLAWVAVCFPGWAKNIVVPVCQVSTFPKGVSSHFEGIGPNAGPALASSSSELNPWEFVDVTENYTGVDECRWWFRILPFSLFSWDYCWNHTLLHMFIIPSE